MKVKILLTIILLFSCTSAHSDKPRHFSYADAVTFLGTENAIKPLKAAVFCVQTEGNVDNKIKEDDWASFGTGFFVEGRKNEYIGITCKHVVLAAQKSKKKIYVGVDTAKGYRRFFSTVTYTDKKYDVAILEPKKKKDEIVNVKNIKFPNELIDLSNEAIIEGRGVLIPGYPLSLGTEYGENHPIIRFGMISQYPGKEYFLIDGFASHGNSGSPVYALKYKEHKLIGMITSHITDHITLYDENGRLSARLPYNSGLARGITAMVIGDILKQYLKR